MTEAATTTMEVEVISRLEAVSFGKVVCVEGSAPERLRQSWDALSKCVRDTGRRPVLIDAGNDERGQSVVYEVLSAWVEEYCEHNDEAVVMRLFEYLTMAMDMGSQAMEAAERTRLIADASVRLVEQLVEHDPAVLMVIDSGRLSRGEREVLTTLTRHFLADPLMEIDPHTSEPPALAVIWDGGWEEISGLTTEVVGVHHHGAREVRRFLSEDRVIERLLHTTQGDREHLEALFDVLPETVSHLWTRRIADLGVRAHRVADVLAVADISLEVSFLDRLVEGAVVAAVRELCERGVAIRRMSGGSVKIGLAGPEIRRGILSAMDGELRGQIHLLLAGTAVATGGHDGAFVAVHALAGGDAELGVRSGLPAARNLLRHGRWEAADELLHQLRHASAAEVEDEIQILELSLRLAEARSSWREALAVAESLKNFHETGKVRGRLERKIATYLTKIGHNEAAEQRFQEALVHLTSKDDTFERVRVMLGLAETAYNRGDHKTALQWASDAQELLEAGGDDEVNESGLLLKCQSMLGKVALFAGHLNKARSLFEKSAADARRQGESSEESRAEANLGVVAIQQGRFDEATRRLERALEKVEMPDGVSRMRCFLNLGIVYQRRGDFAKALEYYRSALRDATRCGDDVGYGVAAHNLATLYQDMGAFDAARQMVAHLRERAQREGADSSFTLRWAAVVETQILLAEGEAGAAIENWQRVESELTHANQLYRTETRLRCVSAYLSMGAVDRARAILEETARLPEPTPQSEALLNYYEAAVACREGDDPEDRKWYSIIDQLESAGLYLNGVEARLELVRAMNLSDERSAETATLIVERGVENLRQRAETLPERFRHSFLMIPSHQKLIAFYQRLSEEPLPVDLAAPVEANDDVAVPANVAESQVDRSALSYRKWRKRYGKMVGENQQMLQIFRYIDRVAPSETTILLAGESGTGKELAAEAIHRQSARSDGAFVKVNCAAFVEELLLSELFGHEKGAFTGAVSDRAGRFERADGGTIFLDEIGDISPKTQVALLRVLQEGNFERVGATESRSVDVRVIAATNRNLDEMVREGTFRLDLYYRLKGFLIEMPPLRKRRDDIPQLLHHFSQSFSAPTERAPRFDDDATQFLARYRWPGNIRELENFVRSVLLFAEDEMVTMEQIVQFREFFSDEDMDHDLPPVDSKVEVVSEEVGDQAEEPQIVTIGEPVETLVDQVVGDERSLSQLKKQLELRCIKRALRETGGNITQAARILQMKRPRLSQIVNSTPELVALKEELVG